jgi:hypothetical protein
MGLIKKGITNLIAVMNFSQAFGQAPPEHSFDLLRPYPTDMILSRISKINAILYLQDFIDQNFLGSKKGLIQIIRQMNPLANEPELAELLNITNVKKINVYPIIVYSDANLDLHGVNEKLPAQFTDNFQSIRPLVMINGVFFMTYYHLLRKKPATFSQYLNDYLKNVNNQKKRYRDHKDALQYLLYNKSFAEHMRPKLPDEDFGPNLTALTADFDLEVKDFGAAIINSQHDGID